MFEAFFYGKRTPTLSNSAHFGILYILVLFGSFDSAPVSSFASEIRSCNLDVGGNNLNIIGCVTFSQKYLTGYYIEKHNSLLGADFHGFLARECSFTNCEGLIHSISNVLQVSDLNLHRNLVGEGSHRRLISTIILKIQPDVVSWFDTHSCQAVIVERLPIGIFADPFELQHLVQHQVYLDAAVFGDTNLELPSALSTQSIVEVHMEIGHGNLSKCCEIVIELPLHARYPGNTKTKLKIRCCKDSLSLELHQEFPNHQPLDASGHSSIEFGAPDLFVRCRPKSSQREVFSWTLAALNAGSEVNNVTWLVPCGNEGHTGFVSTVTFVSALLSALLIVFSAIFCSTDGEIKKS